MKWLTFIFFSTLSLSVSAQNMCEEKLSKVQCEFRIRSAIGNKENAYLDRTMRRVGLKKFIKSQSETTEYAPISEAIIFNNYGFIPMLTKLPDYPAGIEDKGKFLKTVFQAGTPFVGPESVAALFANADKKKSLTWFENKNWPYPLLKQLVEQIALRKDKAKFAPMLSMFEEIESVKKNICQIKSLSELATRDEKYPGLLAALKNDNADLLSCAVKEGNADLVKYLIEHNFHSDKNLPNLIRFLERSPLTTTNLESFKLISLYMRNKNIPFPNSPSKTFKWATKHWNDQSENCFQQADTALFGGVKSITELSEKMIWASFLKEVQALRDAHFANHAEDKKKITKNIIDLIAGSGFPLNHQDADGKNIMHHLAEFSDGPTLLAIEKGVNTPNEYVAYGKQDKDGNTPLHIAVINLNQSGTQELSDQFVYSSEGYLSVDSSEIMLKNKFDKTAFDIVKDQQKKKTESAISNKIREHLTQHQEVYKKLKRGF